MHHRGPRLGVRDMRGRNAKLQRDRRRHLRLPRRRRRCAGAAATAACTPLHSSVLFVVRRSFSTAIVGREAKKRRTPILAPFPDRPVALAAGRRVGTFGIRRRRWLLSVGALAVPAPWPAAGPTLALL